MHGERFDDIARMFQTGSSRRRVIKGLAAGFLGLSAGRVAARQASAQDDCIRIGEPCSEDLQCCGANVDATFICAGVPSICVGINTCVGGDGPCNPDRGLNCCDGLVCNVTEGSDGYCIAAPPTCSEIDEGCSSADDCCDDLICGDDNTCQVAAVCVAEGDDCAEDGDCCDGICCAGACRSIECCIDDDDPNARCPEGTSCFEGYCDELGANGANVTIHKATCPTGTTDIFGDCHGNTLAGVPFLIDVTSVTTDANGVAGTTVVAGAISVTEDAATLANYLGAYVYCSEQSTGTVLFDGSADTGSVTFTVANGDEVICDWYNITKADETDDDKDGGTKLPTTGVGPRNQDSQPWLNAAALIGGAAALVAGHKLRGETHATTPTE